MIVCDLDTVDAARVTVVGLGVISMGVPDPQLDTVFSRAVGLEARSFGSLAVREGSLRSCEIGRTIDRANRSLLAHFRTSR